MSPVNTNIIIAFITRNHMTLSSYSNKHGLCDFFREEEQSKIKQKRAS